MSLTLEDFNLKNVKEWRWIADDRIRRFELIRHDGTKIEISVE